jgi:hypothetical protein
MSLFKAAENTMAYCKIGFMGEAGSGKTTTASMIAIGLVQYLKANDIPGADKPAFLLDTENGSSWIKPIFDEAGIPLMVAKTRAFKDLVPALREAEKTASILIIDSVTHFWEELQESYKASRKRTRLEFQDWSVLKSEWRKFSDLYVSGNLHCILCGRLGHEYDQTVDESGRKHIEKVGVKMQAEKGLGYEPNMLVWMQRDLDLSTNIVTRSATILKDRSRRLDGKTFPSPTFKTFMPHIEFMALGGKHETVDMARNSSDVIPREDGPPPSDIKSIRRQIVVDEIQALMLEYYPSMSAEDKKAKAGLLEKFLHTKSWTEVEKLMPLTDLQAGYDAMHRALTGKQSRYGTGLPADMTDDAAEIEAMTEPKPDGAQLPRSLTSVPIKRDAA